MIDFMMALFRAGVPYESETNTFQVGPEHTHLIEQQIAQIATEENRAHHFRSSQVWDYGNQWPE